MRDRTEDDPIRHGTYAGVSQHNRLGVPMCAECKRARADYQRGWRDRHGATGPGRVRTRLARATAAANLALSGLDNLRMDTADEELQRVKLIAQVRQMLGGDPDA